MWRDREQQRDGMSLGLRIARLHAGDRGARQVPAGHRHCRGRGRYRHRRSGAGRLAATRKGPGEDFAATDLVPKRGRVVARLVPARGPEGLRGRLAHQAQTAAAVALPTSFPADPADRLIYATAVEQGCALVTKDPRLRQHRHPGRVAIW